MMSTWGYLAIIVGWVIYDLLVRRNLEQELERERSLVKSLTKTLARVSQQLEKQNADD